jgi:hypothetical protein
MLHKHISTSIEYRLFHVKTTTRAGGTAITLKRA